jgi:hypothetical protein
MHPPLIGAWSFFHSHRTEVARAADVKTLLTASSAFLGLETALSRTVLIGKK